MKEIKSFYIGSFLISALIFCYVLLGQKVLEFNYKNQGQGGDVINTDFGSFLAAQHALYINDFESASRMINDVQTENKSITQIRSLADFFNGKMPKHLSKQ